MRRLIIHVALFIVVPIVGIAALFILPGTAESTESTTTTTTPAQACYTKVSEMVDDFAYTIVNQRQSHITTYYLRYGSNDPAISSAMRIASNQIGDSLRNGQTTGQANAVAAIEKYCAR